MSKPNQGLSEFFTQDHRECDEVWAEVEAAVSGKDPAKSAAAWEKFAGMMRRHFGWEEEVLFPAFEEATGMHGVGPTAVMRHEHIQMRALLDQMQGAAAARSFDALLNDGDTLLMIIQQHNAKEEGMLYPMAENALADQWPALAERLKK